jgi:hypothetical protein
MSLTCFLRDPEVRGRLAPLRPPIPRKLGAPLLVTPRSGRPTLVGTAFDYLLRFEIHRRALGAEGRHWVAEYAPAMLSAAADGEIELEVVDGSGPPMYLPPRGGFRRAAKRAEKVLNEARFAAADHALTASPGPDAVAALAAHALRLARLGLIFRAGIFDARLTEAAPEDVEDLMALLAVVPFERLLPRGAARVLLNPMFGEAGESVGGADADLIASDMLVDLKTTKVSVIRTEHLDQLLGYFMLARRARRTDRRFPIVRHAALYFARHAELCVIDASVWTGHPRFRETERWFFARAESASEEEEL